MKFLITTILLVHSITSFADPSQRLINKSDRINRMVQNNAYSLSQNEIYDIQLQLDKIRNIINGTGNGGGYDRNACVNYTYEAYYKDYSSSVAMDKASRACATFKDLAVMKILFDYSYKSFSSGNAMTLAIRYSGIAADGKAQIAKYLAAKYYINLDGSNSAKKTGLALSKLDPRGLNCLKNSYNIYYRTLSSDVSADKAVMACQR
jgi:hypothetical protein